MVRVGGGGGEGRGRRWEGRGWNRSTTLVPSPHTHWCRSHRHPQHAHSHVPPQDWRSTGRVYSLYPRKQHYQARWDLRGEEGEGQGRREKVRGGGRRSGEEGEGQGRRKTVMSYVHGHMPSYAHGTHALLCKGLAHQFPAQSRQRIGRRERPHSQAACTPHGQP